MVASQDVPAHCPAFRHSIRCHYWPRHLDGCRQRHNVSDYRLWFPLDVELVSMPHHRATALYKLVYGNARIRNSEELRRVEGVKAFFVNDPSRSYYEIKELAQIDLDRSGTIDYDELIALRQKEVKLSKSQKLMEILTTHPNMLKRIKHLSTLAV